MDAVTLDAKIDRVNSNLPRRKTGCGIQRKMASIPGIFDQGRTMRKNQLHTLTSSLFLGVATLLGTSTAQAVDATAYGVVKTEVYRQSSNTNATLSPSNPYEFRAFAEPTFPGALEMVSFKAPNTLGGVEVPDIGDRYEFRRGFSSQSALDAAYPGGTYVIFIEPAEDTDTPALLNMPGTSFTLPLPLFTNYTAAQSINANNSYTFQWGALNGLQARDYLMFTITDASGEVVFMQGGYSGDSDLENTARSVTITPGTLESGQSYQARLTVGRELSRDTTSYTGTPGVVVFEKATILPITTSSGGNGGGDTQFPILMMTSPASGSSGVPVNTAVTFTFNEPMRPQQAIQWSGNVNAANFTYTWQSGGTILVATYIGGFPQNSPITWSLNPASNPTGFQDLAGNAMPSGIFSGSFTTGSGSQQTNNPCANPGGTNTATADAFTFTKNFSYLQTSASTPALDPEQLPSFGVFLGSRTSGVSSASFRSPANTAYNLESLFGSSHFFVKDFPGEIAMNSEFQYGTYVLTLNKGGTPTTGNVSFPQTLVPPTPQIANFPATQSINAGADFVVQWNGLGANPGTNSSIHFIIYDGTSIVFQAPDPCVPRTLANTATSITVPRNTLQAGKTYRACLTFSSYQFTGNIGGIPGSVGVSKETCWDLRTSGGTSNPSTATISNAGYNANNQFTFQASGTAGTTYDVQSSTDLVNWTTLGTVNAGATYVDTSSRTTQKFYRLRAR
jgi:hypothetical protein